MVDICSNCIHWKYNDWDGRVMCEVIDGLLPRDWEGCLFWKAKSNRAIPKELKQLVAIAKEYKKKALGYDDFIAGIEGHYLSKTGFMIPAEEGAPRRLDVLKLTVALDKAGFENLESLWQAVKEL